MTKVERCERVADGLISLVHSGITMQTMPGS